MKQAEEAREMKWAEEDQGMEWAGLAGTLASKTQKQKKCKKWIGKSLSP